MNFDPVNYVKETLSRVGYGSGMNFDPREASHIFGLFSYRVFRMNFDPLSNCKRNDF